MSVNVDLKARIGTIMAELDELRARIFRLESSTVVCPKCKFEFQAFRVGDWDGEERRRNPNTLSSLDD